MEQWRQYAQEGTLVHQLEHRTQVGLSSSQVALAVPNRNAESNPDREGECVPRAAGCGDELRGRWAGTIELIDED